MPPLATARSVEADRSPPLAGDPLHLQKATGRVRRAKPTAVGQSADAERVVRDVGADDLRIRQVVILSSVRFAILSGRNQPLETMTRHAADRCRAWPRRKSPAPCAVPSPVLAKAGDRRTLACSRKKKLLAVSKLFGGRQVQSVLI